MSQYQRLLLIINPALRQSQAMNHAAALAKVSGASLHIAALIPTWKLLSLFEEGDREKAREDYLQDHRDWLKYQAAHLRNRGIEVTAEARCADDLQQEILDHVAEMQPDLLIKQVQRESVLKRVFITPLDWRLLRHCPIPVYFSAKMTCPCRARSWWRSTPPIPSPWTASLMNGSSSRLPVSPSSVRPSCTCCTPSTFPWCTWAIWAAVA